MKKAYMLLVGMVVFVCIQNTSLGIGTVFELEYDTINEEIQISHYYLVDKPNILDVEATGDVKDPEKIKEKIISRLKKSNTLRGLISEKTCNNKVISVINISKKYHFNSKEEKIKFAENIASKVYNCFDTSDLGISYDDKIIKKSKAGKAGHSDGEYSD